MADKILTEAAWKTFAKGKGYDDEALLKALAGVARAGDDPAALGKALDAVGGAVATLRKSAKGDKALLAQLADIDKSTAKAAKDAEQAAKEAAKEAAAQATAMASKGGDADAEDDSPAALTTAMPALVRQVRAGNALQTLVTSIGKEAVVLLSRKAISTSRRKLLVDYLASRDVKGTPKHAPGECSFDNGVFVFSLQSEAAGLAKKIKAALLVQTGQRLKVRVRGLDGEDSDLDEGEVEGGEAAAAAANPTAPAPADAQRAAFQKAWQAVSARVQDALKAQHPQATRLRAVHGFVQEKADAGDLAAAAKAVDTLRQLLDAPAAGAAASPARQGQLDAAMAAWRQQREASVTMLKELAKQAAASGDPEAKAVVVEVQAVVKQLTTEPRTQQQVAELMRWVEGDDVVAEVDELAEPLRAPLLQRLQALQAALQP